MEEDPTAVTMAESRVLVKEVARAVLAGERVGTLLLPVVEPPPPDTALSAAAVAEMSFKDREVVEVREAMKVERAAMPTSGLEEATMGVRGLIMAQDTPVYPLLSRQDRARRAGTGLEVLVEESTKDGGSWVGGEANTTSPGRALSMAAFCCQVASARFAQALGAMAPPPGDTGVK